MNKRIYFGRIIYFILALLFALCIIIQFYFTGLATFIDGSAWMKHMMFVHLFGFNLPIIMLIFAIIGRFPRIVYWQLFGVFISIFLMYFTVNFNSIIRWVGPLHVIVAILLFILSWFIVIKAWEFTFNNKQMERKENV